RFSSENRPTARSPEWGFPLEWRSSFSLAPHASQRNGKPPGNSKRPDVPVMIAQPAAIAGGSLQPICDVIVHAEIRLLRVAVRHAVLIALIRLVISRKELLHASHQLGTPHHFVPFANLIETVGAFDPISTAIL